MARTSVFVRSCAFSDLPLSEQIPFQKFSRTHMWTIPRLERTKLHMENLLSHSLPFIKDLLA